MTSPSRKVWSFPGAYWWNAAILSVMAVGAITAAVTRTVSDGPASGLPVLLFLAVLAVIAWQLLVTNLYRIELDDTRIHWRRLGTEHSAAVADLETVSTRANQGTVTFRDDRKDLRVFVGPGFEALARDLGDLNPSLTVDVGSGARLMERMPRLFGGPLLLTQPAPDARTSCDPPRTDPVGVAGR
ncbi:hypothetical protein [Solicola sp. PLA-1-18]|uniref:hypothetical protein n=1 Tax=Solicola sp. PLA-1-18 TaxID=3380532 RepID=UPI003B7E9F3A